MALFDFDLSRSCVFVEGNGAIVDKRISELVGESVFELRLYKAALRNLDDKENNLRFNNFAYAMRELSRHFLKRLAPDHEVTQCSWYKNVTGSLGKIARSERAVYAVQGGLSAEYVRDTLHVDVQVMNKRLKDTIDELSKYTHIEESVFDLSSSDVDSLVAETTEAFAVFFETIKRRREEIVVELQEAIDDAAVQEVVTNAIPGLDELSTHQFIDEVYIGEVEVLKITPHAIYFHAAGTLGVELQYGSGSDFRNGDGTTFDISLPFKCSLTCPTSNPNAEGLELDGTLDVDTGSFYDDPDDYEGDESKDEEPSAVIIPREPPASDEDALF